MTQRKIQPVDDEQALRILSLLGEAHQGEVPAGDARAELTRALGQVVDTAEEAWDVLVGRGLLAHTPLREL